jgi:hypothetical protein
LKRHEKTHHVAMVGFGSSNDQPACTGIPSEGVANAKLVTGAVATSGGNAIAVTHDKFLANTFVIHHRVVGV